MFSGAAALYCAFQYSGRGWMDRDSGCRRTREAGDFNSIGAALRMYQTNNGRYPTTSQGLDALVDKPTEGPEMPRWIKLMDRVPVDRWQNEYQYVHLSDEEGDVPFEILSAGPDGVFYTDDDISSMRD